MLNIDNLREYQFICFETAFLNLIDGCKPDPDNLFIYRKSNTQLGTIVCFFIYENKISYGYHFKEILITYCEIPVKELNNFLKLMTTKHVKHRYT